MVFVVASHYQSLRIIVLLLQACLLEIYLFSDHISQVVRYDRKLFKNCFQARLIFYETPVLLLLQ